MSFQECQQRLQSEGRARLCAADFSMDELETAARSAQESKALLFLYNLKGRSCDDIRRLVGAGGRQLILEDMRLI